MKIARIQTENGSTYVVAARDGAWTPVSEAGIGAVSLPELTTHGAALAELAGLASGTIIDPALLHPALGTGKILAIGRNYVAHASELGNARPVSPMIFSKFTSSVNDPFGVIELNAGLTQQGDYEAELAIVIGREAKLVSPEEALTFIFGYAVANDVSARDAQHADGQFDRSKGFDTFCPIGPWITTADEVDASALSVSSWVNGEQRQSGNTRDLIFDLPFLISYITRGTTLYPGDIILTGTPAGVGKGLNPPKFLADGDVVTCEVEGLGRIENRVRVVLA
ncbi:MAG: fumarylacetoacetate hydrolase family protein [Terrimesophilobacter sp.]